MQTTTITPLQYWIKATLTTRDFGHTYVHKNMRNADRIFPSNMGEIMIICVSYGRSLSSGGHKYKVRAVYTATARPVPTNVLKSL
jgi:hypothetical protein